MMPWTVSGTSTSPCVEPPDVAVAAQQTAVPQHADVLLGEERVALGTPDQRLLHLRREHRLREQLADQPGRVLVRERGQREGRPRSPCLRPTPVVSQQLRAGAADDEQRHARRPVDEAVDEVQQPVVGPVQILEDEHGRPVLGDRLEEAAPRGERLAASLAAGAARRRRARAADEDGRSPRRRPRPEARARRPPPRAWRPPLRRSRPRACLPAPSPSRRAPSS